MSDYGDGFMRGLSRNNGIGNLIRGLSMGDFIKQTAQHQAALQAANMAHLAAKAGNEQFTLDRRNDALGVYNDKNAPEFDRRLNQALMWGGNKSTVENIAQGGLAFKKMNAYDDIMNGQAERDKVAGASAAIKGDSMYASGPAGYSQDRFTGQQVVGNSELAALTRGEKRAGITQKYSSANRVGRSGHGGDAAYSNKPLPVPALKMQQEVMDAIGASASLAADLEAVEQQIATGGLDLGIVNNFINRGRNMAGLSSEQSRNLASLEANLERLRNESLRLNKGVQTEGDAERAWNEMVKNLNDPHVVRKRLREIININRRAIDLKKNELDVIRSNFGHKPLQTGHVEGVRTAVIGNPLTPGSVDSGYEYLGGDPAQPSSWRKL